MNNDMDVLYLYSNKLLKCTNVDAVDGYKRM